MIYGIIILVIGLLSFSLAFLMERNKKIRKKSVSFFVNLFFKKDPYAQNRGERLVNILRSFLLLFGISLVLGFFAALTN